MSWAPLAVESIVIFAVTVFLVHRYGDLRKHYVFTSVFVIITWFISFMIVFLLPIDISATLFNRCIEKHSGVNNSSCEEPWSYVSVQSLKIIWDIIYWSSQLLTWIILPFVQSYVTAAQFTIRGKLGAMLKENAIVYGTLAVIVAIFLIYVIAAGKLNGASLTGIAVTASNTWGLFVLVILLGYGLVDIPRSVWHFSQLDYSLNYSYFKVAKLKLDLEDAKASLNEVCDEVKTLLQKIRYNDPFYKYIDTIANKCPQGVISQSDRTLDDFDDFDDGQSQDTISMSRLISTHRNVIRAVRDTNRMQTQWDVLIERALGYEDIKAQALSSDHRFRPSWRSPSSPLLCKAEFPCLEWWWKVRLRRLVFVFIAILCVLASVISVWSEVTFFSTKPILSIFAWLVKATGVDQQAFILTELLCILTVGYLAVCAYYTIFQFRFFSYYYLAPHHHTDEGSLLFCAMFLSRLTAPLCLNFLGMIHLDSHVTGESDESNETAFTQTMGHMDVIPFMANYFFVYFPCILLLLCLLTLVRAGSRILNCCGIQQFLENDEMSSDLISEGKEYVRIERKRRGQDPDRIKTSSHLLVDMQATRTIDQSRASTRGGRRPKSRDVQRVKYNRGKKRDDNVELMTSMEGAESDQNLSLNSPSLDIHRGSKGGSVVARGVFNDM